MKIITQKILGKTLLFFIIANLNTFSYSSSIEDKNEKNFLSENEKVELAAIDPLYEDNIFIPGLYVDWSISQKRYISPLSGALSGQQQGWNMALGPLIYYDFSSAKQSIMLTPNQPRKIEVLHYRDTKEPQLIKYFPKKTAETERLVYRKFGLHLGMSLRGELGFNNAANGGGGLIGGGSFSGGGANNNPFNGITNFFYAWGGLLPTFGREASMIQTVKGHQKLVPLSKVFFKGYKGDVKDWEIGDTLYHGTKGGIVFMAQGGIPGSTFSTNFVAQGEWETHIKKIEDSIVQVQINKKQLYSFGFLLDGAVGKLSINKFKNYDKGFSFSFDLQQPEAFIAYQHMLRGNIGLVQQLSSQEMSGVLAVEKFRGYSKGHIMSARFDVELFNIERLKKKINSFQRKVFVSDDLKADIHYGNYQKEKNVSILFKQRKTISAYHNAHSLMTSTKEVNDYQKIDYAGEFQWTYEDDRTSTKHLKEKFLELSAATGLGKWLAFKFSRSHKNMGFSRIDFRMRLSAKSIDRMMSLAIDPEGRKILKKLSSKLTYAYFKNKKDDLSLCHKKILIFQSCRKNMLRENEKTLNKMITALKNMHKAKLARRAKDFVKAHSRFGKYFMQNTFTFQTVFQTLRGHGIQVQYKVEGEKMARHVNIFEWYPVNGNPEDDVI